MNDQRYSRLDADRILDRVRKGHPTHGTWIGRFPIADRHIVQAMIDDGTLAYEYHTATTLTGRSGAHVRLPNETPTRPVVAAVPDHPDTFIVRVPAPGGQPSSYLDEYGTLSRTGYPVWMSRELADHAVETYLAAVSA